MEKLYGYFNVYTPDMDLAIIKPRWTYRQEFKVELPQNPLLVDAEELQDQDSVSTLPQLTPALQLDYSNRFEESILANWLSNEKPDLEAELERKEKEFQEESRKYDLVHQQKNKEYKEIESKARVEKSRAEQDAIKKAKERRLQNEKTHRRSRDRA